VAIQAVQSGSGVFAAPSVQDEMGGNHPCFFVRGVVERLDLAAFEQSYSVEGGERVDNWALSAFRRRHGCALNDAFTRVLEWAQSMDDLPP
jgi:hypothetical protein